MSTAYAPLSGTIPHKVIEHLKTLPAGTELSTAELCERLDLDVSGPMGSYMVTAVRHGVVIADTRRIDGMARKTTFYSLPVGTDSDASLFTPNALRPTAPTPAEAILSAWPKPAPGPEEHVDQVGAEEMADALAASSAAVPENKPAAPMAAITLEHLPSPGPVEMFQADDEAFVCALWSDGALQLRRGGAELALLSVEETRVLVSYLERMAETAT